MIEANVVYQHLRTESGPALRRGDFRVTWSRSPMKGAALRCYFGAFNPVCERDGAPRVLIQGEPVVTQPGEYTDEVFAEFDRVLTPVSVLAELAPEKFRHWTCSAYDGPEGMWPPMPSVEGLRRLYPTEGRMRGVSMILGNKSSNVPCELYSRRKPAMDWFFEHSRFVFDVYGKPPFPGLNHRGALRPDEKLVVMAGYRWNLCMENVHDPFWSAGYVTERIAQCFETRTVPIYLGCSDIERRIPPELFIDLRKHDSWSSLNDCLGAETEQEYLARADAIDAWVADGNLRRFSAHGLYDLIVELWADIEGRSVADVFGDAEAWTPCDPMVAEWVPAALFREWKALRDSDFARCEEMVRGLKETRGDVA